MLPVLEAEQQLAAIEAASVPYMGEQARAETLRHHRRRLTSDGDEQPANHGRSLTEALMAAGVPVLTVPKGDGTRRDTTKGRRR